MQKFTIGASKIHGQGVIASLSLKRDECVGIGIRMDWIGSIIPWPHITEDLGAWINHSCDPNAELRWNNGNWEIIATKPIPKGCEITIDYQHTPIYIEGPLSHYR